MSVPFNNFFLKVDKIAGESLDSDHKDWINIFSSSICLSNAVSSVVTGGHAGRGYISPLIFYTEFNKATVSILASMFRKTTHAWAVIERCVSGSGDKSLPIERFIFIDVVFDTSDVNISPDSSGISLAITAKKFGFAYFPQNDQGVQQAAVAFSYDLTSGKEVTISTLGDLGAHKGSAPSAS
ncbi:type VI secretion system tube protein Hcp [Xenorhabdus miraniensis]|uniref:Secretion system effector of SST VI cluster n=1 Tax=Xenorhabdus miraniensis TaxID=351674 RepID=A0A2D0JMD7_9GAMM|nr:type VI secretion system tube protein Hcp [Xenorhabdus miraniensis]PHM47472.1 secretion system effector of SST VI cluster [Xenorhabdus miraniensis]